MSSQLQQPNVPQQPGMMSPNTIPGQPQPTYHSHSNGSFGTVFIVLAVIVVISAIACCLGRFCNRRAQAYTGPKQPKQARSKANHGHPPKDHDVEFGFDKKMGHDNPKLGKQSSRVGQGPPDKESEIEFSFDRKMRAPRSGYKPSMEGGYGRGPTNPTDDV
ncbi:uncharacterized protein LOC116199945 [Punica granatum]|uniref:Transmembrane protein n=2 Tax=Punica granatum TaxID=22663 RepID=A0A218XWW4_PUNGR|nr:uncharacterized protein LOC116199945 [Punica granatum]OWM89645.1 hypothetical protein CDL15_Pgr024393 [Punica granatum]PKI42685.1 hypothetical protein CRG98_036967 [Punica granatum]